MLHRDCFSVMSILGPEWNGVKIVPPGECCLMGPDVGVLESTVGLKVASEGGIGYMGPVGMRPRKKF